MTRFENVGVFVREKVWLENSLSPSFLLAQAIFELNLFPYKYSNVLKPSHFSYLSAYEDGTECSETSAYTIQTLRNYPEQSTQYSEYGESLKSRRCSYFKTNIPLIKML
jgi:hypothetical protein